MSAGFHCENRSENRAKNQVRIREPPHAAQNIKTHESLHVWTILLRLTLDEGWGSNFLRTNLDWFEASWILSWTIPWSLAWFLVLQIRSSPFGRVFLVQTKWFSLHNRCHVRLASICNFLGLHPRLKAGWTRRVWRLSDVLPPRSS
jgi:hypothetical protein